MQHLLSTKLPDEQYVDGIELLESYLEEAKYHKKFCKKHVASLKKVVVSLRLFTLASCGFSELIKEFLKAFDRNELKSTIFDSLMAICIVEESMINLYGLHTQLLPRNSTTELLNSLESSAIKSQSLEQFKEFYKEVSRKDLDEITRSFLKNVCSFSGVVF